MTKEKVLENISKLNTFVNMAKSNEFLSIYVEKIVNKRSKSIKFINDFNYISLDLLYTSLQIMNYDKDITKEVYDKIDKKELEYYLDKVKGIDYFKKQVPQLNKERKIITYLKEALANGKYICNNNNTIKFDNGLIVDSDWLVEFANFLITSLNNNELLSDDSLYYHFYTLKIEEDHSKELKKFLKEVKLYEYVVSKKDETKLTYQNIKYLIDTLSNIEDYDFEKLKGLNSILAKEKFTLSVNKKTITIDKKAKTHITKLLNEGTEKALNEYLKDILNCYNSETSINKRNLINNYETLRTLSHAYKCNYTIEECRKLYGIENKKEELLASLTMADFYINYIYDEDNLNKYFDYSLLKLDELNPSSIDYETPEYKNIIYELSKLNKKVVTINRRINKSLDEARAVSKKDKLLKKENAKTLAYNCELLEETTREISALREELNIEKDENRKESNINRTKLKYIKESLINGTYSFDKDTSLLTFDSYSSIDYHKTFHLEITLNDFIEIILSDYNKNIRINFYTL